MELKLDSFSFRYSPSQPFALSKVSGVIPKGSCCAILGPTGAGKSTLLLGLSGALGADHSSGNGDGRISVGAEVFEPMPDRILFPQVGLCLQDPNIMISGLQETVYDEIRFSLENIGIDPGDHETRVRSVMNDVGISDLSGRKPSSLSGGELQRVALASLLVAQPSILLLDEPVNSLDAEGFTRVARIVRGLHGKTTVVFSDHQLELAILVADSILVMREGEVTFSGTKRQFLNNLGEFKNLLPVGEWQDVIYRLSGADDRLRRALSTVLGFG